MRILDLFRPQPVATAPEKRPSMRVNPVVKVDTAPDQKFSVHVPPPGVIPPGEQDAVIKLATDATPLDYVNSVYNNVGTFLGYPVLASLAQRPEHRKIVGTISEEHTRKWIELSYSGDGDASDRMKQMEDAVKRYRLREVLKDAMEHDGFFGRGMVFIDVKTPSGERSSDNDAELSKLLPVDKAKIGKGSLLAFRAVEPVWTYPGHYQSTNPLAANYYRPNSWYVMGRTVHASRVLTIISRPVPDMLKPVYNFGGIPLTQLLDPYVNNWYRTRDSVSDTVHSFSTSILKTDMSTALSGHPDRSIYDRAELFNNTRDNRGLMMLDMENEELLQVNTPLSSLDALQAQSQEHMASISGIPLVKLLGTQPAGLNASSDGEIRVFYDTISASQQDNLRPLIKRALDIIQLSEFGQIDPGIEFEFYPLYQMDEVQQATIRKAEADTDAVYIQAGVLDPSEVRKRIAGDSGSPYQGLDPDDLPEQADMQIDQDEDEAAFGQDSGQWDEGKHPRAENGQFGEGAGGEGAAEPQDITSILGEEYTDVKGQGAIDKLLEEKRGYVRDAFTREGIGGIALVWGDDSLGLQHIVKRRTDQGIDVGSFMADLGEVIKSGRISKNPETGNFEILHKGKMAVISPELNGNKLIFLLTAFKTRKK